MAICIVINGVARRECLDPPDTDSATGQVNWALSHITGGRRSVDATVDASQLQMLIAGRLELSRHSVTTFALPASIISAIQSLISESDRGEMGTASA